MTSTRKFRCPYELDDRLDNDLVNLNQALYRALQDMLPDGHRIKYGSDGMPDPVQYYLLYVAALMYGAADATLTLVLHNLGREARSLERQMFEFWVRASYFAQNADEARMALHSTPFQEKRLLDELDYDKGSDRYRSVLELCRQVEEKFPGARKYREPSVRRIIGSEREKPLISFYALHYRASSQMAPASFNGVGGVWGLDGLSFDSRLENPNLTIESSTVYLLAFMELINRELELRVEERLTAFKERWTKVQKQLHE